MAEANSISRGRQRAGTALIWLVGLVLIASSITKFVQVPQVVQQLDGFGFVGKIQLLAVLELVSGALLLVKRARSIGLLLATAFMGGAIATHLQHRELPVPPAIVLVLVWVGVWLKHPITLWSFARDRPA
jgi:hypothetical protein